LAIGGLRRPHRRPALRAGSEVVSEDKEGGQHLFRLLSGKEPRVKADTIER
jgi:hypothetical protein